MPCVTALNATPWYELVVMYIDLGIVIILLSQVGIAASSAGAGETSASQRHTALATKHVSALAGMLGLDLRDGVKMGSGKIIKESMRQC